MKKILLSLIVCLTLFLGITNVQAEEIDTVGSLLGEEIQEGEINIYFFHGKGCPHCEKAKELFDRKIAECPELINIYAYEVWYDQDNMIKLGDVARHLNVQAQSLPFIVINNHVYQGFSDTTEAMVEDHLDSLINHRVKKGTYKLPLLGEVDASNVSLGLVAIVLGLIDGFNPCAMWVLLFLINLLIKTNNRKKMLLFGSVFLCTSAFVYLLSMLGINLVLSFTTITWIRRCIAVVALVVGGLNIRNYLKSKVNDEAGCHVVNDTRRKKYLIKARKFINEKNIFIALVGIISLAISVNLVELACSLGFPTVFAEILAINEVKGIVRILYLLLYVVCYILDDFIVFIVAVITFELTGISNKYNKYASLIAGFIMIIMGILLMFKPEWIMFNF